MKNEAFLRDLAWPDDLKIRAGYGVTGNQDFANYKSLILMGKAGKFYYNGEWINSYQPVSNPNPDLRWEKKQELNIGTDFAMFGNRIGGTFDYYYRRSTDLLYTYSVAVPPYLYKQIFTNVGTISNQGVELTVDAAVVKHNDLVRAAYRLSIIESRNIEKYKHHVGPTLDELHESGKSWMQIIESSARPGGRDIDLSPIWPEK